MDKEEFYRGVEQGDISYPVFVKPVKGSASININKVYGRKEIEVLFDLYDDLMIQEYMDGTEFGADVYVDMVSRRCTSIFLKKKIKMRAGETDKSVSVKDGELFALLRDFVEKCGFIGMIDIDIFKIGNEYYISEVNPRSFTFVVSGILMITLCRSSSLTSSSFLKSYKPPEEFVNTSIVPIYPIISVSSISLIITSLYFIMQIPVL